MSCELASADDVCYARDESLRFDEKLSKFDHKCLADSDLKVGQTSRRRENPTEVPGSRVLFV